MSVRTALLNVKSNLVDLLKYPGASTSTQPQVTPRAVIPEFLYRPKWGYPRMINLPYLRRLAASPYVSMAVNTIIDEVCSLPWEIVARDRHHVNQVHIDEVTDFFNHPNGNKENLKDLEKKFLRDILEINSGVLVKVKDFAGRFANQMYAYDGGTFTKNPNRHGILPESGTAPDSFAYYQYGWTMPVGAQPIPFDKHEVIYAMRYPHTTSIYGISAMEILADVVQSLVYGSTYDLEYFTNNNIPPGVIQLIGAHQDEIDAFRSRFENQLIKEDKWGDKRRYFHRMPISNQEIKFTNFQLSSQDMELLSKQQWFIKLVWACLGVTPSELGFTEHSNKAVDFVQSKVFKRKAVKPLIDLLEWYFTNEIISDSVIGFGYDDVRFDIMEYDLDEDLQKHKLFEIQLRTGLKTINEIRQKEYGEDPVPWGEEPFKPLGGPANVSEALFSRESEEKALALTTPLFPRGNEKIVPLDKTLKSFLKEKKKEILQGLTQIQRTNKLEEIQMKSLFTDFVDRIKAIMSPQGLKATISAALLKEFSKGAEELEVKVGFNVVPNKQVLDFLNHYTFSNVKDMTDEIANDLRQTLQRGLMEGKSIPELKKEIQKIFNSSEARAEAIARTETARATNIGSLEAAKQSGLKLQKGILVHVDGRTSDLCLRLHKKYEGKTIPLNEQFVDDKTGETWNTPPFHVNCRTTEFHEEVSEE